LFPARTFKGKRVAVFGLARTGTACIEAMRLGGAEVHAWDDSAVSVEKARSEGLPVSDLHALSFAGLDSLILSPGVPLTHPEPHWSVRKALAAGVEVIGDTEAFQREIAGSGARTVAITGTNGKSTTTALIGHVFTSAGRDADIGGNIGKAAFLLPPPAPGKIYVLELSSFQIDLMPGLKPDVGVLTNLTPDHLDRHGTMEHYADVKARMFAKQAAGDTAAVGVDDQWCAAIAARIAGAVKVSVRKTLDDGVSAAGGILRDHRDGTVIDLRAMPALKGAHNWQNACMAYIAGRALGLSPAGIETGMRSFPGLAHRMQEIARLKDVPFINDSKATNADAAEKALSSFDNIHWIAGGLAKSGGIAPLEPYFPRIARAYLIGAAAQEFADALKGRAPFEISGTMDAAVSAAAKHAGPGATVLLSPACASFDQYPNFEVRGDAFAKAVAALPGIQMLNRGT
jgi:UDP-N-acetylmuramoylalanine--D-glutamate ligase